MARTLDQIAQESLGGLHWIIIKQQAQIEALRDEVATLKKPAEKPS